MFPLDFLAKYRGKPLRWWLETPLYASRIARRLPGWVISRIVRSHPAIWRLAGSPVPAPAGVKRGIVRGYAVRHRLPVFVETGTWRGDTTQVLAAVCQRVYSIELSEPLYRAAQQRFQTQPHVTLLQGDSGQLLPPLLETLNQPCLFWLDGHFSGGDTVRGDLETPIEGELRAVLSRALADPEGVGKSVILIDDARDFGRGDYPAISKLREIVKAQFPDAKFSVQTDIIRVVLKPLG